MRAPIILLAAAIAISACTLKKAEPPPLAGPSEFSLSLTLKASPDLLSQDGASQAQIVIEARDANGKGVANLQLHVEITVNGIATDYGQLSTKNVFTDSAGRASLTYTAPPPPPDNSDPHTIVTLLVIPTGTDYANQTARSVDIRLVPPGIIQPPFDLRAGFKVAPASPIESDSVTFDSTCSGDTDTDCVRGSAVSWAWTFGDGGTASGPTVTHAFRLAGNYAVTLTVADSANRAASATKNVTIGGGFPPTASFVFSPTSPTVTQTVFFNGSGSKAATGRTIVGYEWDFGNGRRASGVTATTTYDVSGTYTVTLVVTDDADKQGTVSSTVAVAATGPGGPVADFTFSPTSPTAPATVSFNASASSSPAGIVSYAWDFGDTSPVQTVTVPNTTHLFASANAYVVTLTVTDANGARAIVSKTVTVK
jgi:PKD repeat protein